MSRCGALGSERPRATFKTTNLEQDFTRLLKSGNIEQYQDVLERRLASAALAGELCPAVMTDTSQRSCAVLQYVMKRNLRRHVFCIVEVHVPLWTVDDHVSLLASNQIFHACWSDAMGWDVYFCNWPRHHSSVVTAPINSICVITCSMSRRTDMLLQLQVQTWICGHPEQGSTGPQSVRGLPP